MLLNQAPLPNYIHQPQENTFVNYEQQHIYVPQPVMRIQAAQANRACDITQDVLLVDDLDDDGSRRSYLKCQPMGDGTG